MVLGRAEVGAGGSRSKCSGVDGVYRCVQGFGDDTTTKVPGLREAEALSHSLYPGEVAAGEGLGGGSTGSLGGCDEERLQHQGTGWMGTKGPFFNCNSNRQSQYD